MAGLEARLTSRGAGRFAGVAFLALWLCFWIVGEVFALGILVAGGWALVNEQPMGSQGEPLETGPALLTGVFLLAWVTFWTIGGLLAWRELFRLLWSSDRLLARGDGLEVVRRTGLFAKRHYLPAEVLLGFSRVEARNLVQVETRTGVVELTGNGTPEEQERLIAVLTAELRLKPVGSQAPVLPAAWREVRAPEGGEILVRDPAMKRVAARIMWIVALPLAWVLLVVLREVSSRPGLLVPAVLLAGVVAWALWAAVRLTWSREEWRLEPGLLVRQRRFGPRRREELSGSALRLTEESDSDGDRWFTLVVLTETGSEQRLVRHINDPTEPRQLGRWLAARIRIPFEDRATPEERERAEAEKAAWQADQRRLVREWLGAWWRSLPGVRRRE